MNPSQVGLIKALRARQDGHLPHKERVDHAHYTILDEARDLVYGDRGKHYGPPHEDFSRTAKMWSAILGADVDAATVALCMIALKVSRECNHALRDNAVDIAGYADTLARVRDWEAGARDASDQAL